MLSAIKNSFHLLIVFHNLCYLNLYVQCMLHLSLLDMPAYFLFMSICLVFKMLLPYCPSLMSIENLHFICSMNFLIVLVFFVIYHQLHYIYFCYRFHQVDSDDLTIAINFWWKSNLMSCMSEHMDAYYLRRILRRYWLCSSFKNSH